MDNSPRGPLREARAYTSTSCATCCLEKIPLSFSLSPLFFLFSLYSSLSLSLSSSLSPRVFRSNRYSTDKSALELGAQPFTASFLEGTAVPSPRFNAISSPRAFDDLHSRPRARSRARIIRDRNENRSNYEIFRYEYENVLIPE